MIVGLVRPEQRPGHLLRAGCDELSHYERPLIGSGYLLLQLIDAPADAAEQNILAILETLPLSKPERRQRVTNCSTSSASNGLKKNPHGAPSGGEKRRLTIARSLVTSPSLLMLDEPFSGVDPIASHSERLAIVVNLRKSGLAILITDHNVRETLSIVDRAYLIYEGRVESEGMKDFLINDPIGCQLYLGERFQM